MKNFFVMISLVLNCYSAKNVLTHLFVFVTVVANVFNRLEEYLYESCEVLAEAVKGVLINNSEISTTIPVLTTLRSLFQLFSTIHNPISDNAVRHLCNDFLIKSCHELMKFSQVTHRPSSKYIV